MDMGVRVGMLLLGFACLNGCTARAPQMEPPPRYAIADIPTPLLNTPNFPAAFGGRNGKRLHLDGVGLLREVEVVALPGAVFTVTGVRRRGATIAYRVTTEDYPYPSKKGYYVDSRFVTPLEEKPPEPRRDCPHPTLIRYRLLSSLGSIYVWGGNWRDGMEEMNDYYPPPANLSPDTRKYWMLRGVDCSGLIYEATGGYSPRNASSLVKFGEPVAVEGLTSDEIADRIEPLDLIGWRTHVVMVLDKERIIQSRVDYDSDTPGNQSGVRTDVLRPYLGRLMKERKPVDDYNDPAYEDEDRFVVRRWCTTLATEDGS